MEKRDVKSTVINSILILLAVLLFLFFSYTYGEKQELGNMKPNYVSGLIITMFYVEEKTKTAGRTGKTRLLLQQRRTENKSAYDR